MKILKTITEIENLRKSLSGSIGFIPTMGYLHNGHISLVKQAKKENDYIVVSVFVNPKQFGPNEDFQKYPRNTEKDIELLESAETDILFLPDVNELYRDGFETYVSLDTLSKKLEGEIRPGHFTGVATVLTKFFHIIQPARAYFGQKDAQQVVVVKKIVDDLNFPLDIVVGETVREADGLAMSSRNVFLTTEQRQEAPAIYESLRLSEKLFQEGTIESKKIKMEVKKRISQTSGIVDYISIAHPQTLEEMQTVTDGAIISLAVRFGSTRLIDNIVIKK